VFSGAVPSYELTDFGATRRDANDRAWLAAEKEDRNRDWVALTQVLVPHIYHVGLLWYETSPQHFYLRMLALPTSLFSTRRTRKQAAIFAS
jgi:hypothetical protein